MTERTQMIEWIRSEMVGPGRPLPARPCNDAGLVAQAGDLPAGAPGVANFTDGIFADPIPDRKGPLVWAATCGSQQEVLYFRNEPPHRKYGIGLLHPDAVLSDVEQAAEATDRGEKETEDDDANDAGDRDQDNAGDRDQDDTDDFDVASPDVRRPSTMGISFCVSLQDFGTVNIQLPSHRIFAWQELNDTPFELNGRYESLERRIPGQDRNRPSHIWRRHRAFKPDACVKIQKDDLQHGRTIKKDLNGLGLLPDGSPVRLSMEVFPRWRETEQVWLLTAVLRNTTGQYDPKGILFQAYFEVTVADGRFVKYPESQRPFQQLDEEEQSLALLYSESATWGIGHGCSAGWDAMPGENPDLLYADVLPAVQLPSMTPDITGTNGNPITLSMRELAELPDGGQGGAWVPLAELADQYGEWILARRQEIENWAEADPHKAVAQRHLDACDACLVRINAGITLLRDNANVREAFRLANLAMLLQQISTKKLQRRPLEWNQGEQRVKPSGNISSPWDIYVNGQDIGVGSWRAFQIAFLLMSLDGVRNGQSDDREVVDLIWFPTGGGKTEAYLGVMAFYMFHERLQITDDVNQVRRDGTNVLMRYTLRMLTTQQFQRAASLICAMEFLRRNPVGHNHRAIRGDRFSLGLWIGRGGSPNYVTDAWTEITLFKTGQRSGNPLVLTECPWCRAEIGRLDRDNPFPWNCHGQGWNDAEWNHQRTKGIKENGAQHPLLLCPDIGCEFGNSDQASSWLPVEVIDERIYEYPPSLVISTVDKLAIAAYRPKAGSLFGRRFVNRIMQQISRPPGLIIQDELHLISGPLGTMYALYEGVFERLCTYQDGGQNIKPKLIASTATIRGGRGQVKSLYDRSQMQVFPCPGIEMGDSFFGKYARGANGQLSDGRLYLGIHAGNYGSVLTTQVRAFASALFRPFSMAASARDPWWTLLAFYNSIRELSGGRTLFNSDITSRLKFMFNREGFDRNTPQTPEMRRTLRHIEELTSRRSQADIVLMMDRLAQAYGNGGANQALDVCLASNIIEVGVDIERLSLMGVVGQPKTTASYIQVTGRVGRRWWERPGLILMIYNPGKSRDRSHFEQFHSYHRRLYERVEPTSATPFAVSALQRGLAGALLTYARQQRAPNAPVNAWDAFANPITTAFDLLKARCCSVQSAHDDQVRSSNAMDRILGELQAKWQQQPEEWQALPQAEAGHYLMLWPGQHATTLQKARGVEVPSSMRQVDGSGELRIIDGYSILIQNLNQL